MSDDINLPEGAKIVNPRTYAEMIENGMTPDQAEARLARDVFGANFERDKDGNPIERGHGSPWSEKRLKEKAAAQGRTGFQSNHEKAIEVAKQQKAQKQLPEDVIAKAVEAGVLAGLQAAAKKKNPGDDL